MTHAPPARIPRSRAGIRLLLVLLTATALVLPLLHLPAGAQETDSGVTAARVQGENRFDTAARIAGLTFDQARVAVVVTGRDFPDALAGSFAAGRLAGPILLVEPDGVPGPTLESLADLGVEIVVMLGGTNAIDETVEGTLETEGYTVQRIEGRDRYHTAAEVALEYGRDADGRLDGDRTAILATGENFPDALSAGPLAARAQLPLLLTPGDRTMPVVDDALAQLGIERIVVVGGDAAVSSGVVAAYENQGYAIERFAGPSRTATAAVVADNAIARLGFDDRVVLLARGDAFPDALTASMHGATLGAPILLARSPGLLSQPTAGWLAEACPQVGVVRALGGGAAIQPGTLGAAVDMAERCVGGQQEVARFATSLLGIPDRTHNLHLAADYIDGDVIAAGAGYSLNQGIGRRTRARGFREVEDGCIGSGGEAVDCVGGGVSQMATTFMNAAWFTGIEFIEFRQHTIYFPRYPMCHEATLSWGSLDVQVHNNSPYDIVIDAFYDNEGIGVRFLSREWASVESWSEPQTPPSSGSFTSQCGRTITYPDGTTDTESYTWTYDGVGF